VDIYDTQFMRALNERVEKMIEEKRAQIINRGAKSYDEYLAMCESVLTLRAVLDASLDIAKRIRAELTAQSDVSVIDPRRNANYRA